MPNIFRTAIYLPLLCLGLVFCCPPSVRATESVDLYLKWYHQFQFSGYYMAKAKGYYAEQGLEVTIHGYAPGDDVEEKVLSGEGGYGVAGSELLLSRAKGHPVVALAAVFQHSPSVFLSLASSNIHAPRDMVGKRVMLSKDSEPELWATLRKEGISKDQITIAPPTWNLEELIRGDVDTTAAYVTNYPYLLTKRGVDYTIIYPRTYGVDFYGDCLFTSSQEVQEHGDRVRRFREASLRGWEYALKHPEESIEILRDVYGVTKDRGHLEYEARTMRGLVMPEFVRVGHMNPSRWSAIAETYAMLGMLPSDFDFDGFLYEPKVGTISPLAKIALYALGSLVLLTILASVWLTLFNRRLKAAVAERTTELEREVAERRSAEQKGYDARRRLEDAIEAMGAGVAIFDAEDRLMNCNSRYREFYTQITDMLVPGVFYEDLLRAYWESRPNHLVGRDLDTWVRSKLEQHKQPHDETEAFIEGRWLGIVDRKTSEGGVVSLRYDLSEQFRVRNQLRRAKKKADEASRSKSDFLARMSHEIRTPMNACLGMLGLLRSSGLSAPQLGYLDKAMNASRDLLELIDEILDFSKVESGKVEMESRPFILSQGLASVISMFQVKADQKGIRLELLRGEDVPDVLVGDARRLNQVLINLLGNAMKFTRSGSVTLEVQCLEIRVDETVLEFSVSDTGIGIPREMQDRIFDAFTQSDGSMTRRFGGTGLGLSISRRLVELMGGELQVRSVEGEGSEFRFVARFSRLGDAEFSAPDNSPEYFDPELANLLKGERILVAEDSSLNLEVIRAMLEQAGAQVLEVTSGLDVLELLEHRGEVVSAVVMDVQMPGLDGFETTRAIRERVSATLPIVGISAHVMEHSREMGTASGMNAYLFKPISAPTLLRTVSDLLHKEKAAVAERAEAPEAERFHAAFVQSYGDAGEKLAFLLESGDREAAARLAHELAGVSGNVGEERLGELSKILELDIARGETSRVPEDYLVALQQALERCRHGGNTAAAQKDNRELSQRLHELRALLESNEHVDSTLISDVERLLSGSGQSAAFARIGMLVGEIQYQEALDLLLEFQDGLRLDQETS